LCENDFKCYWHAIAGGVFLNLHLFLPKLFQLCYAHILKKDVEVFTLLYKYNEQGGSGFECFIGN